jgi:hypothetical protein
VCADCCERNESWTTPRDVRSGGVSHQGAGSPRSCRPSAARPAGKQASPC